MLPTTERPYDPMHTLARHLLGDDADDDAPGRDVGVDVEVWATLEARLGPVLGTAGLHALVSRALREAADDHPRLREVDVSPSGSSLATELSAAFETWEPHERSRVVTQVLDALLGTLEDLVGPDLVSRLLSPPAAPGPSGRPGPLEPDHG